MALLPAPVQFDVMVAYGYLAWMYFVSIAVFGGMFVVNLFLAVIFDEFMRVQEAASAEQQLKASALSVGKGISGGAAVAPSEMVDDDEEGGLLQPGKEASDGAAYGRLSAPPHYSWCDCRPAPGSTGWRKTLEQVGVIWVLYMGATSLSCERGRVCGRHDCPLLMPVQCARDLDFHPAFRLRVMTSR